MNRLTCHFHGRVQGVGFRYTTQNLAMQYRVGGYVRNLPNGCVEVVMEGADEEMNRLVEAIQSQMSGFIKRIDRQQTPGTGEFSEFTIRH